MPAFSERSARAWSRDDPCGPGRPRRSTRRAGTGVGRIEASAQTDLQDGDVDPPFAEGEKSRGGSSLRRTTDGPEEPPPRRRLRDEADRGQKAAQSRCVQLVTRDANPLVRPHRWGDVYRPLLRRDASNNASTSRRPTPSRSSRRSGRTGTLFRPPEPIEHLPDPAESELDAEPLQAVSHWIGD